VVPVSIDAIPVVPAFCALLAICYLSVRTTESDARDAYVARTFAWIGGIGLIPCILMLVLWDWPGTSRNEVSGTLAIVGWMCAFLLPVAFSAIYRKKRAWMNAAASLWVFILSALTWRHVPLWTYAWCAVGAAGMIAWGIYEFRPERINLGMVGFALTILFFYFSDVMDKLGRSASLIVLGFVFLVGAWYWEKLRRKLVARVQSGGVA